MRQIVYDKSFEDFCDEDGRLVLDLEEYVKVLLEKGEDVEFLVTESLQELQGVSDDVLWWMGGFFR